MDKTPTPNQVPDAEALYGILRSQLEGLRTPKTQVVGIASGGEWIAQRLQHDWQLPNIGVISTSMHRDDFSQRGLSSASKTKLPFSIDNAHIILLDDVLHTGRSVRAAINELFDFGRPSSIQLGVLVVRSGQQLPIAAQAFGAHVEIAPQQSLELARHDNGGLYFELHSKNQPYF